jgi:hypothetical protein
MKSFKIKFLTTVLLVFGIQLQAQTDMDGLMMAKRNLCGGIVVGQSQWNHYWEGTLYRNNENIGTFTSQMAMAMANYGISDKFNIIASAPYLKNQTSAGTLRGQQGLQDLSMTAKWEFFGKGYKHAYVSLLALGTVSASLTNYVADYLPLAIGMQSKTASGKLMIDIQRKYVYRRRLLLGRQILLFQPSPCANDSRMQNFDRTTQFPSVYQRT